MLGSKEWYEILNQFEQDCTQRMTRAGRMDREPSNLWPKHVYQDGMVNQQFQAYLTGYSLGKQVGRSETER